MRPTLRVIASVLLSAPLFCPAAAQPAISETSSPPVNVDANLALTELLHAFGTRTSAPGITAALVKADGTVVAEAWGQARLESPGEPAEAMTPAARMMSGSVGKTYFAALFMLLVEDGVLDLDARIGPVLKDRPWFASIPNASDLTLRMLLRHQSGIPEHIRMEEFQAALRAGPQKVWKPEELLAFVCGKPPLFKAGEGWSYADTNYILAGVVVEAITQRPVYDMLRERILGPLGLNDTDPNDTPRLRGLVSGYTAPSGIFPVPERVAIDETYACNPQVEWTGGGLITTSTDLAKFGAALFGGKVVSRTSLDQMLDTVSAQNRLGPGVEYGLGVIKWQREGKTYYGHSGWFPGYVTLLMHDPGAGAIMAVQINTDQKVIGPAFTRLGEDILALAGNGRSP
ncbi:MAG: serine hydrolase [Phycisphaerae bacterium]